MDQNEQVKRGEVAVGIMVRRLCFIIRSLYLHESQ